ncbi:hypothetical protein [Kitasatospora griseola]|uniref:hypothetical protein n=1 Tax=Kitasatospora griseola TaxID=2064 RepID=UPI00341FCC55
MLELASDDEQPAVEEGVRDLVVDVVEEGQVDGCAGGAVVQGDEDCAAAGAHRRGLDGDLGAGDQDGRSGLDVAQSVGGGDAELGQQRVVIGHQVPGGVHPDDLQLGVQSFGCRHFGPVLAQFGQVSGAGVLDRRHPLQSPLRRQAHRRPRSAAP